MPASVTIGCSLAAEATARSNRSSSRPHTYVSKSACSQYESNVALNFSTIVGASTRESRTFHSTPSSIADVERFDEPMNTVEKPDSR